MGVQIDESRERKQSVGVDRRSGPDELLDEHPVLHEQLGARPVGKRGSLDADAHAFPSVPDSRWYSTAIRIETPLAT